MVIASRVRQALAGSLAALTTALDAVPSVGRTIRIGEPVTAAGQPLDEDVDEEVDDLVIDVGGLTVFRYGGWGSRFTLLPMIVAELEGTDTPTTEPARHPRAVDGPAASSQRSPDRPGPGGDI